MIQNNLHIQLRKTCHPVVNPSLRSQAFF